MSDSPQVLVVSGLPGAGKTVTAQTLASRFERAAHIEADLLHDMIKAGSASPDGLAKPVPGDDDHRQLQLRLEQACLLARSFVEHGFTAIVDEIVINERLDELLAHLKGLDVGFVMLDPPYDHVRARWVAMGSPFADAWEWLEAERQATRRVGLWLDTSQMTIGEVVDEILSRLDETILAKQKVIGSDGSAGTSPRPCLP